MLSVVIPLLNEEDSLDALYGRLKAELTKVAPNHEIFFVDDGSRDGSLAKLVQFFKQDPSVHVLSFGNNFGKAAALAAGFKRLNGQYVMMMDADLQDQPEEMLKLIRKLDEGYDLVTGWKQVRHDPIHKTLPSKLFNRKVGRTFNLNIHDFNCGFKLMRAEVARNMRLYGDFHRFLPVLAQTAGYRVAEVPIEHAPRIHGYSKYGAKRLITGLLDYWALVAVTKFYYRPMQFFGNFAIRCAGIATLFAIYALATSHGNYHLRLVWVLAAIFAIGSAQLVAIGLVAEMLINGTRRVAPDVDVSGTPRELNESLRSGGFSAL